MPKQNGNRSWYPPKGFQRVDSKIPEVVIYAPEPEHPKVDPEKSYACPNCGANIAYDVAAGGIACEFCGYVAPVRTKNVGQQADEFEFTLETISRSNQGWGTQRKVLSCDSCGTQLSLPEGILSISCPFCASNQVNIRMSLKDFLRPRFLVPFKITPEETHPVVTKWLGKGWFHPKELTGSTILQHFNGVYLPFWTFDARVNAPTPLRKKPGRLLNPALTKRLVKYAGKRLAHSTSKISQSLQITRTTTGPSISCPSTLPITWMTMVNRKC